MSKRKVDGCFSHCFENTKIPVTNSFIKKIGEIEKQVYPSNKLYNLFHYVFSCSKQGWLSLDNIINVYSFIGEIPDVFRNGYYFVHIDKLKDVNLDTADLEISKHHNYIANGFISHNTINMKADYPVAKLNELLLEYGPMIKGTTLYREGCKGVEILTPVDHTKMTREEILKIGKNN